MLVQASVSPPPHLSIKFWFCITGFLINSENGRENGMVPMIVTIATTRAFARETRRCWNAQSATSCRELKPEAMCGAGRGIGIIRWQLSTGAFRSTDAVQRMRQITSAILARDGVRGMYLGLGPSVLQVRSWPLLPPAGDLSDTYTPACVSCRG